MTNEVKTYLIKMLKIKKAMHPSFTAKQCLELVLEDIRRYQSETKQYGTVQVKGA